MQETKSIILKPSIRTTAAYYALALSITVLFIAATIIEITNRFKTIHLDTNFGISGFLMSLFILAIVIGIHLWMKSTTYMITERDAQVRYGLIADFENCIQLRAVTSIRVTQGRLQRIFNIGNLTLYTGSLPILIFWDIDEPEARKEEIWKLVAKAKKRLAIAGPRR